MLEKRLDELVGEVRLAGLDRRLYFLPYGMVLALQGMLKDGKVNSWEHHHFMQAVDADGTMNRDQKTKVRRIVDGWFATDSGTKA